MEVRATEAIGLFLSVVVALLCSKINDQNHDEQIQQSAEQHFEVIEADHSADLRFARHAMIYVVPTKSGYLNLKHVAPGIVKSETGLLQLTNLGKGAAKDIRLTFLSGSDERHEVKALDRLHLLPEESMTLRAFPGQGFKLKDGKSYVSAVVEFKDHRNEIQTESLGPAKVD